MATRLSAIVKNDSVHSFQSVRFEAVVSMNGTLLAAGEVVFDQFKSFAERILEVTWLQSLPVQAEVKVYPVVNLLDRSIYAD